MNILVTGATGFIGSHLTAVLCAEGHRVTCLVRKTSSTRWIQHLPVSYRYDLEELSQYGVIYHLAGVLGKKGLPLSVYREPHVEMTKQIISNMNKHTKLVCMSSAWVIQPKRPYELTKLEGEQLLDSLQGAAIVRPSFVYGPRDLHHLPLYQYINRLGKLFPIVGSGRNKVCPTYIKDVIDVLLEAKDREGIMSVAGKPLTMNEFIWAIADALGTSRPFIHVPFGPRKSFFTEECIFPNMEKQTPLGEGLRTSVDWYKQNNLL